MRIGIDARIFDGNPMTGITRSVYEVIKQWIILYPNNEYYLFSAKGIKLVLFLPDNWHVITNKTDPFITDKARVWFYLKVPSLLKKYKIDVFWGTNYTLPKKVKGTKYILTIYDLALLKFKDIGEKNNTRKLKYFVKGSCKKADKIIAISKATKEDVHELFNIPYEKITLSYCGGLSSDYDRSNYDLSNVKQELVFDNPFVLFISTIEPRKNIITLVKAFEVFNKDKNYKLVLAGNKGWRTEDIYKTMDNSTCKDDIVLPGYINDDEKKYLLSKAKCFVYPSLYEGFGIPILEAFAYNLPTITTSISSLPEVGGDGALYIDNPYDYNDLAKNINKACNLKEKELDYLKENMNKQLTKFSWEKNAREMMDAMSMIQ